MNPHEILVGKIVHRTAVTIDTEHCSPGVQNLFEGLVKNAHRKHNFAPNTEISFDVNEHKLVIGTQVQIQVPLRLAMVKMLIWSMNGPLASQTERDILCLASEKAGFQAEYERQQHDSIGARINALGVSVLLTGSPNREPEGDARVPPSL